MLEKISLSDKDCEYLSKGIAAGAGIGVILGAILNNVVLLFSLGGVAGIIIGLGISACKKRKILRE